MSRKVEGVASADHRRRPANPPVQRGDHEGRARADEIAQAHSRLEVDFNHRRPPERRRGTPAHRGGSDEQQAEAEPVRGLDRIGTPRHRRAAGQRHRCPRIEPGEGSFLEPEPRDEGADHGLYVEQQVGQRHVEEGEGRREAHGAERAPEHPAQEHRHERLSGHPAEGTGSSNQEGQGEHPSHPVLVKDEDVRVERGGEPDAPERLQPPHRRARDDEGRAHERVEEGRDRSSVPGARGRAFARSHGGKNAGVLSWSRTLHQSCGGEQRRV